MIFARIEVLFIKLNQTKKKSIKTKQRPNREKKKSRIQTKRKLVMSIRKMTICNDYCNDDDDDERECNGSHGVELERERESK